MSKATIKNGVNDSGVPLIGLWRRCFCRYPKAVRCGGCPGANRRKSKARRMKMMKHRTPTRNKIWLIVCVETCVMQVSAKVAADLSRHGSNGGGEVVGHAHHPEIAGEDGRPKLFAGEPRQSESADVFSVRLNASTSGSPKMNHHCSSSSSKKK